MQIVVSRDITFLLFLVSGFLNCFCVPQIAFRFLCFQGDWILGRASRSFQIDGSYPPYLSESGSVCLGPGSAHLSVTLTCPSSSSSLPFSPRLISSVQYWQICSACDGNFGLVQQPMNDGAITFWP